jgi:Flp pilus assembly CpaF family ATPase
VGTITNTRSGNQDVRQASNLAKLAGPLVDLLSDPRTLDVVVNSDGAIWVNHLGSGFGRVGEFDAQRSMLLLRGIATIRDIHFDHDHPILETIFPLTGDRIEGVTSPVVPGVAMALRTRQKEIISLAGMVSSGVLTHRNDPVNWTRNQDAFLSRIVSQDHLGIVRLACFYRRNVLLAGPTGSGKTTAANSIIYEWSLTTPDDRVIIIEDTPELQCSLANHVQLLTTSRISQAELLIASMRLIPTRIVMGEIRDGAAAEALLNAWNTGHSGGLATIHANDSVGALRKLETLVGGRAVRERIANAIHLVIFIDSEKEVRVGRKVREIVVIKGYDQSSDEYALEYV